MRFWRPIIIVLFFALLGTLSTAHAEESTQLPLSDLAINTAVAHEFSSDAAVPADKIVVKTQRGVVTLTGTVNNILASQRAAHIAMTVRGVQSVINDINVSPSVTRSDADIHNDINAALVNDPATEAYEIDSRVVQGYVTLKGRVESYQEKKLTAQIARGVRGVLHVDNQLVVNTVIPRTDVEIEREIEQAFEWHVLVNDDLVGVTVKDHTVYLSGTVGSAAEAQLVTDTAWMRGVKNVDSSKLTISPWARNHALRAPSLTPRDDASIKIALQRALRQDARINHNNVDVDVQQGVVTLQGVVNNLRARDAATQDAKYTLGVLEIDNALRVRKHATLTDAALEKILRDAIARDPLLEREEFDVKVIDQRAFLTGSVDSPLEKSRVYNVASRVKGIDAVFNHLTVDNAQLSRLNDPYLGYLTRDRYPVLAFDPRPTLRPDVTIERSIHRQLLWSPYVDANAIRVDVKDGVATLKGRVDSWVERQVAIENALDGGAISINDQLVVER